MGELVINPKLNVHQAAQGIDNIMEYTLNRHARLRKVKIRPNFKKGLSIKTKALMRKSNSTFSKGSQCKNLEKKYESPFRNSKKGHQKLPASPPTFRAGFSSFGGVGLARSYC